MKQLDDTIAAISTPVGQGGIGIVRISGPIAIQVAEKVFHTEKCHSLSDQDSHKMIYGHIVNPQTGDPVDEVLLSVMRAPHSYTKEDVVEINCHGGMIPVQQILEIIIREGIRPADPGEFTRRAFLNGRISLPQAEAVMDLIAARTEESKRIAFGQLRGRLTEKLNGLRNSLLNISAHVEAYIDFPEEEIETKTKDEIINGLSDIRNRIKNIRGTFEDARLFREGLSVAIVGRPNVGKSSLLNALLQKDRAIVTEVPGTTRDLIDDYLDIEGLPVRLIDTAGIRHSNELVEKEGIKRSIDAINQADYIIAIFDGSEPLNEEDLRLIDMIENKKAVFVINKSDLPSILSSEDIALSVRQCHLISAKTGRGIEELKRTVFSSNLGNWKEEREGVVITSLRHKTALEKAEAAIERAQNALKTEQPLEIFSIELREAMDSVGEITGAVTTDDILDKIFLDFCIGK